MLVAAGADPRYASPGVLGFLVIFFLAVATWLLIRSMVGHLRKVRYSAELAERQAAEVAAGGSTAGGSTAGDPKRVPSTPGPDAAGR
ncbi:MAG TPA: hypothetical protein VI248_10395 [Kineosporiaceae bacterium]